MASYRHSVQIIEITAAQEGQRIDNYLLKHLKNVPKSHIYRLLRSGQVRVNSGRKKPSYKLNAGDTLRIPPVQLEQKSEMLVPDLVIQQLSESIIYQDDNLLAINKPSGIAVHGGSGLRYGVIEAFRQLMPNIPLELVHRLDRETSGCLLMAKNRTALTEIHRLFRQDNHDKTLDHVEKIYHALVCGRWSGGKHTVNIAVSKTRQGGEHRMCVDANGLTAISHFEPLKVFENYTLMRIKIETGRMHQIRIHALHCYHPIAGDSKYGDKKQNQLLRTLGLKRLFLHASSLSLPLKPRLTPNAPLSPELKLFLSTLK